MDVDFPFVLSVAVLITGAFWACELAVLRPQRLKNVTMLKSKGSSEANIQKALREPTVIEYAKSFFPVLLLVLVLRSFVAEPYQIPSESMVPTFEVGDFILVNKYQYGLRLPVLGSKIIEMGEPERGDIMVFVPPHDPRYFIKRVIGLPGDSIRYENKALYINGVRASYELVDQFEELINYSVEIPVKVYKEKIGDRSYSTYRYQFIEKPGLWVVPEGHYFVMGDNRGKSEDSRAWRTDAGPTPFVPDENVVGKAIAIWMHKKPGLEMPTFRRNAWLNNEYQG